MLSKLVLLLLAVGLATPLPFVQLDIAHPRKDNFDYRLPSSIKPISYLVKLNPDIPAATFIGSVYIDIKVLEETDNITLHYKNIDLKKEDIVVTNLKDNSKVEVTGIDSGLIPEQEFLVIKLGEKLTKDDEYYVAIVKFAGILADDNNGFYWAEYKDEDGTTKRFATTQFEPTHARRAFPCFDEPALKAKFKIFLTRPKNFNAISNTRLKKTRDVDENTREDEFEETLDMSTYLLAFIVSELDNSVLEKQRVFARPRAKKEKSDIYALETGIKILDEIEKFVGVMYLFEKMDQAAIPDKYFSAGAMENWGLVTYREQYLLADQHTTSSVNQSIATIIAHEYGHQWFGNHVSPAWWKYLWLNEGFATYFEFFGASLVFPEWRLMDQFVVKNTQYAFGPDSLTNTRAMNHDAGSPAEIWALFDRIAYQKSGSVIRMMEMFLTTPVYKQGLNSYLKNRGLKEATPQDLYRNLQDALDKNPSVTLPRSLDIIMQSWDSIIGFPVINVQRNYDQSQEAIKIEQSRFLLKESKDDSKDVWYIPLNFATKQNPNFENTAAEEWMTDKTNDFTVSGLTVSDWLIVNKQQTGYYRVNYDEENWKLIIKALKADPSQIHHLNRAQLIDDAFNLARSGRLQYAIPLELATYLQKEHDYIPFYSFFTAASFLNTMLPGSATYSRFKNYVLSLLHHVESHVGLEEKPTDEHLDKINRVNVINWMCNLGNETCRSHTLEVYKKWMLDDTSVAPDLQASVYCGAMRTASQEEWDFLFKKYMEVADSEDTYLRTTRFNALGCSENTDILEGFLNKATASDSKIKPADALSNVYSSGEVGLKVAFEYVEEHFKTLHESLKDGMESILTGIGGKLTTEEQLNKMKDLSTSHKDQEKLFESAIALAQENVDWNKQYRSEIHDSLPGGSASLQVSLVLILAAIVKQLV